MSDNIDLTFEQLNNKLLQKDRWKKQFRNNSGHDAPEVALATKFKGKGKANKAKDGHKESNKSLDSSNQKPDKIIKCFYCGKIGHKGKFCRRLWKEDSGGLYWKPN